MGATIICAACGQTNPDIMKFCGGCGAKLEAPKAESACSSCGYENPAENKFCGECGAKLEAAPASEQKEQTCPSCGAKPSPGVKFCQECGAKIGETLTETLTEEKTEMKLGEVVMLDPKFQDFSIKIEGGKHLGQENSPQYHFDEWLTFKLPASLDPNSGDHEASIYAIKHAETYKGNYENDCMSHTNLKAVSWSPRFGTDVQFYLNAADCLDGLYDFVLTFDDKPVACITLDFVFVER